MVKAADTDLHRAANLRANLRRIFDAWAIQSKVAADAGIHAVQLAKILGGTSANPTISTIERLSVALEIPVETLISNNPSDIDLRITKKLASAS